MVPPPAKTPKPKSTAGARRKLTEEMTRVGKAIEKEAIGSPQRLEALRKQASLSDKREALRDPHH